MDEIKTILFDLDGTLLPMEGSDFEKVYLGSISDFTKDIIEPRLLIEALWKGTNAMVACQDNTRVNIDVFYETFESLIGSAKKIELDAVLDDYYSTHFDVVKVITEQSEAMKESVQYLKGKGYQLILATNPLFPKLATNRRIEWAGLSLEDFDYVTRMETSTSLKPNLAYFEEIVFKNNLDPKTCLMIGNDAQEDLVASQLGMKTWLITDNLIDRGSAYDCDWQGTRNEFILKLKEEL